jgi:hypothetical protein
MLQPTIRQMQELVEVRKKNGHRGARKLVLPRKTITGRAMRLCGYRSDHLQVSSNSALHNFSKFRGGKIQNPVMPPSTYMLEYFVLMIAKRASTFSQLVYF